LFLLSTRANFDKATPFIAAVAALLIQVRGKMDPATISSLLAITANPNLFNDGNVTYPYLAPAIQQGGGLVQAWNAAYSPVTLSVASISFNDTAHFLKTANFSIKNTGSADVTYTLGHHGAAAAYTLVKDGNMTAFYPPDMTESYAAVSFDAAEISVPAASEAIVSVTLTPPSDLDASRLPVYSGYITLNSTNAGNLSLPYLGVFGR
jgi:hypothetical protein